MASLMDRIREALGVNSEHTAEHTEVRRELTQQRSRLAVISAIVEARTQRDRRRMLSASHPDRRSTDR